MAYLTPKQVAYKLQISRGQVQKLIAWGDLRAFRVGHLWRISDEDLQAYVSSTMTQPPRARRRRLVSAAKVREFFGQQPAADE